MSISKVSEELCCEVQEANELGKSKLKPLVELKESGAVLGHLIPFL